MSTFTRRLARRIAPLAVIAIGTSLLLPTGASALPDPVGLGTATSFAVLAGAGITNTGPTTITGDTGAFPTTTETGFAGPAPDTVTFLGGGVDHAGDAVAQGAKNDLVIAYDDAAGRLPEIAHAVELGGDILDPGVYVNGTFGITGTLTLDFHNDLTASFIFKTASTLITAANADVVLINADADAACRVTWKVGSSATFGTAAHLVGDVLAHDSITATTGATFAGRLLARDGAVTLDTNTINRGTCTQVAPTTTTTTSGGGGGGGGSPTTTTTSRPTTTTTSTTSATTATTATTTVPTTTTVVATSAGVPSTTPVTPTTVPGAAVTGQLEPRPRTPGFTSSDVPELPRTGSETVPMTLIGLVLVAAGLGALAFERRSQRAEGARA